ncbi:MAG: hypothetical protein HYV75_06940 [Opitutae bacterium]|nr:hypothetical protein [Opitutae bacterium]
MEKLHLSAAGTAAWVENISRTSAAANRLDAATYELSLGGNLPRQLAPSVLFVASGEIGSFLVPEYELNDSFKTGGRLSLQRKFGLGPLAPVLQFSVGGSYKSARLAADRGWTTDAGVQLAKRVFPNLRLAAGASWLEHNARSEVFDLNQRTYSLEAGWDINTRWTLAGSACRLESDIVANAAWAVWGTAIYGGFGPTVKDYYNSRPWSVTNLYGYGWVSYNVEADVDLWSVALTYAFSNHASVGLRKSAAYVVNHIGITYPTDSWGLGLNYRF